MGKMVLVDAAITVDGVDLSPHFSSVEIADTADEVEFTAFAENYDEFDDGLKDAVITCEAFQDYDAGSVDETLYPLYSSNATFVVSVQAVAGPESLTNPAYEMLSRLYSYNPVSGGAGDANSPALVFRPASGGLLRWGGPLTGEDAQTDPYFEAGGVTGAERRYLGIDAEGDPFVDPGPIGDRTAVGVDSGGDIAVTMIREG